jgi:uncharacterized SAM-binding protein YcdF (DUF218 family)
VGFAIKQLIGTLASPVVLALLLAMLAAVLRLLRRPRATIPVLSIAAFIAYSGSIGAVSGLLNASLEAQHPPLADDVPVPQVPYVVVLGSSYAPDRRVPITSEIDAEGLIRIVEGVRLARLLPEARLVVSGGAPPGRSAPAEGYAVLARSLGIDERSLLVISSPLDTAGEARDVVRQIGTSPFMLVTSAYHMPRAMRLMTRAGARPIPAPAGQQYRGRHELTWRSWLPTGSALRTTERALHEYLGLAAIAFGAG